MSRDCTVKERLVRFGIVAFMLICMLDGFTHLCWLAFRPLGLGILWEALLCGLVGVSILKALHWAERHDERCTK